MILNCATHFICVIWYLNLSWQCWMTSVAPKYFQILNYETSQQAQRRCDNVVTTSSQRRWRCHDVLTRSKMRVVPTSVSDVVTTSLSNVIRTLPQRCCNVATTFSIGFLGHFTTDYSDFYPFIEMWESYQSAKWFKHTTSSLFKRTLYL